MSTAAITNFCKFAEFAPQYEGQIDPEAFNAQLQSSIEEGYKKNLYWGEGLLRKLSPYLKNSALPGVAHSLITGNWKGLDSPEVAAAKRGASVPMQRSLTNLRQLALQSGDYVAANKAEAALAAAQHYNTSSDAGSDPKTYFKNFEKNYRDTVVNNMQYSMANSPVAKNYLLHHGNQFIGDYMKNNLNFYDKFRLYIQKFLRRLGFKLSDPSWYLNKFENKMKTELPNYYQSPAFQNTMLKDLGGDYNNANPEYFNKNFQKQYGDSSKINTSYLSNEDFTKNYNNFINQSQQVAPQNHVTTNPQSKPAITQATTSTKPDYSKMSLPEIQKDFTNKPIINTYNRIPQGIKI